MPGRALKNPFIARTFQGKIPIKSCYQCIEKCNPADTPYCITEALVDAVEGRVDEGLIFMGEGASELHELTDVATVIQRLFP
jgi:NAD(P)H-dependent flavin oxidoreductase YrpB (nitropropane dioxygenase family)